jgi:hypothetical protein
MKGAMRTRCALLSLGLALGLAATGCASEGVPPEVLQGWVGRPATALEKDWGPATREVQDGELKILVYEELRQPTGGRTSFSDDDGAMRDRGAIERARQAYWAPKVYVRSYLFWVDAGGRIVHSTVRTP